MVAFSRITVALAVAGLSAAQSFSGPAPSVLPTDFSSGAARPTGSFGGRGGENHSHRGDHSGFAHPTGGFHSRGPKPSATGAFGAESAQQSGEAPFPIIGGSSAFPSGAAKHSGHHGHHGKSGHAPSGVRPTGAPPSGKPSSPAPTGFITSTIRGA